MNSSKDYLINSVVIIIPIYLKPQCDYIAEIMGWGGDSFSVPLSADGGATITHYGLRSECDDHFIGWLSGEGLPWHINVMAIEPMLAQMIIDVSPDKTNPQKFVYWGKQHFDYVCREHNLIEYNQE